MDFLKHNWPWLVWPILSAFFNVFVRYSDEDWDRLERTNPRWKKFVEFMRDFGVHPKQVARWFYAISAAKSAELGIKKMSEAPPPMDEQEARLTFVPTEKKDEDT